MPNLLDAVWYEFYLEWLIENYRLTQAKWSRFNGLGMATMILFWGCLVVWLLVVIIDFTCGKKLDHLRNLLGGTFAVVALFRWVGLRKGFLMAY
jgi:hypothetical protein